MKDRYVLVCLWDKEYVFTFKKENEYKIAKGYYSFLINPQVTIKEEIQCFETFFLNKVSNILKIREEALEAEEKRLKIAHHKPKRKYISVKDIYGTCKPINTEEFSEYYEVLWGLDK